MTNSEYLTLSKELQYLVKNTSLTWGRIQNNKTDNKIDMFNCANYQDLLMKSKNLDDKLNILKKIFLAMFEN